MYADVLLLGLHHAYSLLPHSVDNSEDVDVTVAKRELLEYTIQSYEGPAPADSGAAMDHDWTLIGSHLVTEGPHESGQNLRWIWYTKVGPRREVEVLNYPLRFTLKSDKRENLEKILIH